jgi:2,3-bisphosphoglycerate-independent phosphoglycerate mutase
MSAREISGLVRAEMTGSTPPDFICVNFANPDMVGHTGVFDAIVQAVEVTDSCLGEVLQSGRDVGYSFVVIADHGNADLARNPNGTPHTAHTTNPVPVVVEGPGVNDLRDGKLADIAPTVLDLLDLKKPEEMTGSSLLIR